MQAAAAALRHRHAHAVCKHDLARFMLENHILEEGKDAEELQKLSGKARISPMNNCLSVRKKYAMTLDWIRHGTGSIRPTGMGNKSALVRR